MHATTDTTIIGLGTAADERALAHLAALDSAEELRGPVLTARVDGKMRAAVSLLERRAIADPFAPTAALVELLTLRARQLGALAWMS
jgi:hypothetical protein